MTPACFTCVPPERLVPHRLFTPLLTTMVATGVLLTLVLMLLLYKYLQVREEEELKSLIPRQWPEMEACLQLIDSNNQAVSEAARPSRVLRTRIHIGRPRRCSH